MIVCPTFMSHILDESLLNSGNPRDSHVRYGLSHSNILEIGSTNFLPTQEFLVKGKIISF